MEHNFNFDRCSTENPFSVPEGYFEDFCRRMEVLTTPKKISLLQRIRPYWYAAKNGRDRVQQRNKQNIGRRDQRRYDCRLYPGGYGLVG